MKKLEPILSDLYRSSENIPINNNSKIVIMSDLHRGAADQNDNYLNNVSIVNYALKYYYKQNYTYIELGDGDELWENSSMDDIVNSHKESFMLIRDYFSNERFISVFGNHDMVKKDPDFLQKNYYSYYDERYGERRDLFPNIAIKESIVLKDESGVEFFLFHGHQGDFINDTAWKLGRFLVRYVWRFLEMWSFKDPTKASKNYKQISNLESVFLKWAEKHNVIIITGHTHRAVFSCENGEHFYFNSGSGVSPNGITAIEIEGGNIALVEWKKDVDESGSVIIRKEILDESRAIIKELIK